MTVASAHRAPHAPSCATSRRHRQGSRRGDRLDRQNRREPTEAQRGALQEPAGGIGERAGRHDRSLSGHQLQAPPDRLEAMVDRLWAMRQAVITLRAPLETFYGALTDEQKSRIDRVARQVPQRKSTAARPRGMGAPPLDRLCSDQAVPDGRMAERTDRAGAAADPGTARGARDAAAGLPGHGRAADGILSRAYSRDTGGAARVGCRSGSIPCSTACG